MDNEAPGQDTQRLFAFSLKLFKTQPNKFIADKI